MSAAYLPLARQASKLGTSMPIAFAMSESCPASVLERGVACVYAAVPSGFVGGVAGVLYTPSSSELSELVVVYSKLIYCQNFAFPPSSLTHSLACASIGAFGWS